MRLLPALATGLAITTISLTAAAFADGAPGNTGKAGGSCTSCHAGNAAKPTVAITGPATLAAGQTGDYTMTVTTNLARGSGGVAATDGVTLVPGTGFQAGQGELSHTAPLAVAGGKATFTFKVTAPAAGGAIKLFAVGMGSNGTGTGGDGTTQITKDITVTGGATPTTPTTPTTPEVPGTPAPAQTEETADTATPGSSTTSTSKTTTPAKKKTKPKPDADEDEEEEEDDGYDPYAGRGGCSSTGRGMFDASAASAAAMVLFAFGLVRRRSRKA